MFCFSAAQNAIVSIFLLKFPSKLQILIPPLEKSTLLNILNDCQVSVFQLKFVGPDASILGIHKKT
jgi:hypothetical protein